MKLSQFVAIALVLSVGLAAGTTRGEDAVFKNSTKGTPEITTIDVLGFGPQGTLLIGDGKGSQVIAVQTGDTAAGGKWEAKVEGLDEKLGGRLGTNAKGIQIIDMVVNPASGKAYFAIRKTDDKKSAILTVDAAGKIGEFALENVTYARLGLPRDEKAPVDKITDVAWAGDRLLAAARANEEFAAKIYAIAIPLAHDGKADVYSAETFHVAHGRWETKAPMSVIIPFDENGQKYVIGAFACTPVVKYAVDSVQPGAKVKGVSVLELGSGNQPIDMFTYKKDGKEFVLANTFRFHHAKAPFGPSPYWTVRFERDVLSEKEKVNETALRRLGKTNTPATERVQLIESFHGVMQMDQLNAEQALVIRTDDKGRVDLEAVVLP